MIGEVHAASFYPLRAVVFPLNRTGLEDLKLLPRSSDNNPEPKFKENIADRDKRQQSVSACCLSRRAAMVLREKGRPSEGTKNLHLQHLETGNLQRRPCSRPGSIEEVPLKKRSS